MKIEHRQIRDRDHGIISEWHDVTDTQEHSTGHVRCSMCGRIIVRGLGRWWEAKA